MDSNNIQEIAIAFILTPEPLFKLLTNHTEIINNLHHYVPWLLPVLGFGSITYALDGYFLGLTQGHTLRQSPLKATLVGFAPSAIVAWYFRSSHLLWLSHLCLWQQERLLWDATKFIKIVLVYYNRDRFRLYQIQYQ